MQAADFKKYLENPQLLSKQSIQELQQLVKDFPYFQSAHILLSLASKKWDASLYQQSLKKTAIVVTNRAHLFHLIHTLEQPETPVVSEVEKNTEIISVEKEIPKQEEKISENENAKQELEILKVTESIAEPELEANVKEEEFLEKEISKQVVTSFVEKEILKTPELHRPEPQPEPENFGDWLTLLKKNNGPSYRQMKERVEEEKANAALPEKEIETKAEEKIIDEAEEKRKKHRALIDKIIEDNPGKIRPKEEQKFFTPDHKAKESLLEHEHLVTETLAKIYALQDNVNKAIRAYEILSLRFPQKSAYFATLIKKLKE